MYFATACDPKIPSESTMNLWIIDSFDDVEEYNKERIERIYSRKCSGESGTKLRKQLQQFVPSMTGPDTPSTRARVITGDETIVEQNFRETEKCKKMVLKMERGMLNKRLCMTTGKIYDLPVEKRSVSQLRLSHEKDGESSQLVVKPTRPPSKNGRRWRRRNRQLSKVT